MMLGGPHWKEVGRGGGTGTGGGGSDGGRFALQ